MENNLYTVQGRKYNLTEYGLLQIKEMYDSGMSQLAICKIIGVSEDLLRRWMVENNIQRRTTNRKYELNEHYFDECDSPEKAYWLGFLSADGYNLIERGNIQLQLQASDKSHIEKFAKAIQYNRPLSIIYSGNNNQYKAYRLVVCSMVMSKAITKYGIIQNKSLVFAPTNIPEQYFAYWILGYMDGDGCIYNSKGRIKIAFTGTYETLALIKEYFASTNQIRLEHNCKDTYQFTLEVALSEKFLSDIKYKELPFVLERKRKRYCSFI